MHSSARECASSTVCRRSGKWAAAHCAELQRSHREIRTCDREVTANRVGLALRRLRSRQLGRSRRWRSAPGRSRSMWQHRGNALMGAPHSKRRGHGSAGKRRTHYEDPIAAIDFARRSGGIEADISRAAGERMIGRRSTASAPNICRPRTMPQPTRACRIGKGTGDLEANRPARLGREAPHQMAPSRRDPC